jgi:hypothetical protein
MIKFRREWDTVFTRNIEAEQLLESFFVSAVSSLLLIRFYLQLTGYPKLGGASFHIAHMLWGGFFMLIAMFLLLAFLTPASKQIAAVIGGVGFGTFIDELGKFITRDNDYFYQPAVAMIYVIFVLLYLAIQAIDRYSAFTRREYLINAIELMKDVVINDLDKDEKAKVLGYLKNANQQDDVVKLLKKLINETALIQTPEQSIFGRFRTVLRNIYNDVVKTKIFTNSIIFLLIINSLTTLVVDYYYYTGFFVSDSLSFSHLGIFISSLLSTFFILLGFFQLRRSRLNAYVMFKNAMLVSILLTQVFAFYTIQFFALIGLAANIALLVILEYMVSQERSKQTLASAA